MDVRPVKFFASKLKFMNKLRENEAVRSNVPADTPLSARVSSSTSTSFAPFES